jgi:hypothetical protein
MDPMASYSFCGICCCAAYGSLAQRNVANLANLTDVGAHTFALETDDAEEIEDALEERELSETMDSGDDEEDEPEFDCTEGRRLDIW